MTHYRHTQIGLNILLGVGVAIVLLGAVGYLARTLHWMLPAMALLALIAALFGSLTTEISGDELRCRFGIGLIRKRFPLRDVVKVTPVRNAWIWGWGIRYTPRGWLYNVSGLSAVELSRTDGTQVRVGTDQPEQLAGAIRRAIGQAPDEGAGTT